MTTPQQQAPPQRKGREGARWINERPTPEEFAAWFRENVKIHDGLNAEDYVGGVVLIPVTDEKAKFVKGWTNDGKPVIDSRPELYYVPYAKVEARVAYFWDLMDAKADDWFGIIEPIELPRASTELIESEERILDGDKIIERDTSRVPAVAQIAEQLPVGFGLMPVPVAGAFTHFLVCSYHVAIYKHDKPERPIREGRGTKMVPLVLGRDRPYADQNSIMKAETGAVGRALGMAGIFVIPGSGVATAEDMIDAATTGPAAQQGETAAEPETGPATPAAAPVPERTGPETAADEHGQLVARAKELVQQAHADYPDVLEKFREWGAQRNPPVQNLGNLSTAALRGAVKKLEKLLDEAKQAAAARGEGEPDAAPAAAPEPEPAPAATPAEEAPGGEQ